MCVQVSLLALGLRENLEVRLKVECGVLGWDELFCVLVVESCGSKKRDQIRVMLLGNASENQNRRLSDSLSRRHCLGFSIKSSIARETRISSFSQSFILGNPIVLVFTLKVLLARNPSILVLALKVPQSPKKKANQLCCLNDKWKATYKWIEEVNNQNRAHCTIRRKEFGVGHGGEGNVKTHVETKSHQFRVRQVPLNQSKVFLFPQKTSMFSQKQQLLNQFGIPRKQTLSYGSLDCSMKLNKLLFPTQGLQLKYPEGKQKEKF